MIASLALRESHDDPLILEDHHPLTVNSPLRYKVEARFIAFLSEELKKRVPQLADNTYDMFVIRKVGRIYARWFKNVSVFPGMTPEIFSAAFLDSPQALFVQIYPGRDFVQHMDNLAAAFPEFLRKKSFFREPEISHVDEIEKGTGMTYDKVQQILNSA